MCVSLFVCFLLMEIRAGPEAEHNGPITAATHTPVWWPDGHRYWVIGANKTRFALLWEMCFEVWGAACRYRRGERVSLSELLCSRGSSIGKSLSLTQRADGYSWGRIRPAYHRPDISVFYLGDCHSTDRVLSDPRSQCVENNKIHKVGSTQAAHRWGVKAMMEPIITFWWSQQSSLNIKLLLSRMWFWP